MPSARLAPAASRGKNMEAHEQVTTGPPRSPGIPRAMVLTVSFALPGESGFLVTIAGGRFPAGLTPASRRQDHTTSPSRAGQPALMAANIYINVSRPQCGYG
jgi:hypothetical protein